MANVIGYALMVAVLKPSPPLIQIPKQLCCALFDVQRVAALTLLGVAIRSYLLGLEEQAASAESYFCKSKGHHANMPNHHLRISERPLEHHLAELQGEVNALKGMLAVLISHVALLNRAPLTKRDEILSSMSSMLPGALASIEQNASAGESAGFERAIETVTDVARNAIRIEPSLSPKQGDSSR